jgi:hypothetical protein
MFEARNVADFIKEFRFRHEVCPPKAERIKERRKRDYRNSVPIICPFP